MRVLLHVLDGCQLVAGGICVTLLMLTQIFRMKLFSGHAYGSVPLSILQLETYDDTFLSADSELIGKGEEIWCSEVDGSKDEPQF
jgi:hypothetical protein